MKIVKLSERQLEIIQRALAKMSDGNSEIYAKEEIDYLVSGIQSIWIPVEATRIADLRPKVIDLM